MFKIAYDGSFNSLAKSKIPAACEMMVSAIEKADLSAPQMMGLARKKKWFGPIPDVEITRGLKLLHRVVNDDSRTVTFVNATGKKYWCAPAGYDDSGTPPPPPVRGPMKKSVNAMVYAVNPGFDFEDTDSVMGALMNFGKELTHAGSGMRLYLYQGFFSAVGSDAVPDFQKDIRWLALIIVHELTHKVLNTHDIVYGPGNCLDLVTTDPEYTLLNADTWACYITSFIWPEMLGD